jgi:hypothetical protein
MEVGRKRKGKRNISKERMALRLLHGTKSATDFSHQT